MYNVSKISDIMMDWMKDADCWEGEKRHPISFSIINDGDIYIISPDAGKLIGKKGKLVKQYMDIFKEALNAPYLKIEIENPDVMICSGTDKDSIIFYYNDNK